MSENVNPAIGPAIRATIENATRLDISEIPPAASSVPTPQICLRRKHANAHLSPEWGGAPCRRGTDRHPSDSSWLELFAINYDTGCVTDTSDWSAVLGRLDLNFDFIPGLEGILGPTYFGLGDWILSF